MERDSGTIRVLIIDDMERYRTSLQWLLKQEGFEAESAGSGEEALGLLAKVPFDVVLLDLRMPGMGGMDALPKIKSLAPTAQVIILTGHASVDFAAETIKLGAADFLVKPCPVKDLIGTIRKVHDLSLLSRPNR